jgi:hypothetical protein
MGNEAKEVLRDFGKGQAFSCKGLAFICGIVGWGEKFVQLGEKERMFGIRSELIVRHR